MTDDLITRLKAATEGSRELSDEVLRALGWGRAGKGLWSRADVFWRDADPTRSMDDALSLRDEPFARLIAAMNIVYYDDDPTTIERVPLAICIAALEAKRNE